MREITIGKNDAGQRLDRFVSKSLPLLPPALLQKYIRLKRIKCNGARAQRDQRLQEGDVLQLYINDEFFDKPREDNLFLTLFKPSLDIVYEDENLLLLNKRPGRARRRTGDHPLGGQQHLPNAQGDDPRRRPRPLRPPVDDLFRQRNPCYPRLRVGPLH